MPGVELASAYISLLPSARGIGSKIATEIGPPLEAAGRDAGEKASRSFGESFKKGTSSLGSSFAKVGLAATAGLTVPIIAAGKAAFDSASSLNESISKTNVIFGSSAGEIQKWAATAATALGQSKQQALEAASTFGNLFLQLGIAPEKVTGMSTALVGLASDFASLHNADISEVLVAQTAAFRGEFDAVQRFVPTINAAAVEQEALRQGLAKTTKELTPQHKALATQALLLSGAGKAAGNFALTSGDAANKQRILTAQFENAKATLGQALLPIFLQIASAVSRLAERFATLSPGVQKLILVAAGVLAIAGPLGIALGGLITVVGLIASPVGLIVAAIAALAAGLVYAYIKVDAFRALINGVAEAIGDFVVPRIQVLVELFRTKIIPAVQEAAQIIGEALAPKLAQLQAAFERNRPEIEAVIRVIGAFIDKMAEAYAQAAGFLLPVLARVAGFLGGQMFNQLTGTIELVGKLVRGFERLADAASKVGGFIGRLGDGKGFDLPGFANGGIVPGPLGSPQLIVAHGGEAVLNRRQQSAGLVGSAASSVAVNVAAPIDASTARQIEQGARVAGWLLSPSGRR